MKRILFTVSNDLTTDRRMHRICHSLQATGYDVVLIGRRRKHSKPLQNKPFRQVRLNMFFEKGFCFYAMMQIRLFFYLLFTRFDEVCGTDLDTILPCYLAARLKNKKCYYDAHELFTEVPEVIRRKKVRAVWLRIEKFICTRQSIKAYTVSQSVADELKRRYGKTFRVIRNFPDKKIYPVARRERTLLYRGAVNEGRGLESLLSAMKHIDARLIIAGDGDITQSLQRQILQQELQDKVSITGYLTPDELDRISLPASIGLNLLDDRSKNYYFSLANKFFDYVQLHIPQVCMNFPEYAALNTQYEVAELIEDIKPETISKAVNRLLNDSERYAQLLRNCQLAAEEWCWQNEEKKLLDIYR